MTPSEGLVLPHGDHSSKPQFSFGDLGTVTWLGLFNQAKMDKEATEDGGSRGLTPLHAALADEAYSIL